MKLWNYERFHPLYRRYIFQKTTGGGQIDPPPPAILGLQ